MFEIAFMIIVVGAIAGYSRGRGGNPWLWGTIAVSGYVILAYVVPMFVRVDPESDWRLVIFWSGFAWLGGVALCTRYLLGSGRKKPSSMWTCPKCKYLNQRYAVICEACQCPYGESAI